MIETCTDCGYAFEGECRNPACVRVNPEAHARHTAEADRRETERLERERIRDWASRHGYAGQ